MNVGSEVGTGVHTVCRSKCNKAVKGEGVYVLEGLFSTHTTPTSQIRPSSTNSPANS